MSNHGDWIIIGDTDKHKDCLVCVCAADEEGSRKILERMINNPTKEDKILTSEYTNLRLKYREYEDCWWKIYGTD